MGAPTVSNVQITSNPNPNGSPGNTYSSVAGYSYISVSVSFSEMVAVTGTPRLALTIGTQTRQADYQGGDGTSSLSFSYRVQSSDVDTDGISITANALTLNGGTIQDSDNNNAVLSLGSHAISNASGHKVDGRTHLTFIPGRGRPQDGGDTYGVNEVIGVLITLSGSGLMFVPATPSDSSLNAARLALTIGANARQVLTGVTSSPGSNSMVLVFRYEIQSSDLDADGISIAADALTIAGGTIQGSGGSNAHLDLGTHAFANDASRKVDGRIDNAPKLVYVNSSAASHIGTIAADDFIDFRLQFGEDVAVTGMPRLTVTIGTQSRQAIYMGCGGSLASLDDSGICVRGTLIFGNYVAKSAKRG